MAVDDLWYLTNKGPGGERLPSKRHGRGKRWRVRYADDAGKPRERLFDKKVDADRWDANIRADVSRGVYVDPAAGKVTVRDFGEKWRDDQLHRDSTAERVERFLRLHVYPVMGGTPIAQVRPSNLKAWVKNRSAVLEPSTLRVGYSTLTAMFTAAVIDRLIGVSPCQGIALPDIERSELFIPTPEQVHALADAFTGTCYQAQPEVVAGTGVRQGELWGLELEHVDFLRRKVHVVQQLKVVAGRKPFLAQPKTPSSVRDVDLAAVTAEVLARHIEAYPPAGVEVDDETNPRKPVRRVAKLIFLNAGGDPIHRASFSHVWQPAVVAAGLPPGFGMHGLRDMYATFLIFGGASVKTVQMALGHSTPTTTLNHYVGLWPDAVETTRALVDNALRRSRPGLRAVTA